ncbi:MAG: D-aminoacyl-tRNA deacylase [Chlamydiota bacterium]
MRALLQRVSRAQVRVEQEIVGQIDAGLLVFLGIHREDTADQLPWLVTKLIGLRLFSDHNGKMNLSLNDIKGSLLIVSQFTLYGDCRTGRRPSFTDAMPPQAANLLYRQLIAALKEKLGDQRVATGQFGAIMEVDLVNDGPVTLLLER